MQRQDQGAAAFQQGLGAADFRHARQEGQDVAVVVHQSCSHRAGHCVRQFAWTGDIARGVVHRNREHAARAFDHLGIHQSGEAGAVRGGRHGNQPQLRTQYALQVEAERQSQVAFQRPLVHFVEDDGGDAFQCRVGLQAADQQAFGHHLDQGSRGNRCFQARAEADDVADGLAAQLRHAGGGRACRQPPRLQHEDALIAAPRCAQQRQRHQRRLAGTRWRHEDGVAACGGQGAQQRGKGIADRQVWQYAVRREHSPHMRMNSVVRGHQCHGC